MLGGSWRRGRPGALPEPAFPVREQASLLWRPRAYFYRRGTESPPLFCYGFLEGQGPHTVLGATWMLHTDVIFDLQRYRLGLAEAECPEATDRPGPPTGRSAATPGHLERGPPPKATGLLARTLRSWSSAIGWRPTTVLAALAVLAASLGAALLVACCFRRRCTKRQVKRRVSSMPVAMHRHDHISDAVAAAISEQTPSRRPLTEDMEVEDDGDDVDWWCRPLDCQLEEDEEVCSEEQIYFKVKDPSEIAAPPHLPSPPPFRGGGPRRQ